MRELLEAFDDAVLHAVHPPMARAAQTAARPGAPMSSDDYRRRMHHFQLLDRAEQATAIKRLAGNGWTESTISAATGLSVEQIRRILAENCAPPKALP